jgi:hypothetical protein
MRFSVCIIFAALRLTSCAALHAVQCVRPRAAVRMQFGESEWVRKQRMKKELEQEQYRKLAEAQAAEAARKEEERRLKLQREEEARAAREAEQAAFIDEVDLYRPGGVLRQQSPMLTREALENAEKISSPSIDAEAALQAAVKEVGGLPPDAAISRLEATIVAAVEAGVFEKAPALRRAIALKSTLEIAAADASAAAADGAEAPESDPLKSQMDALFGAGYAVPDLDDEDDW